MDTLNLDADKRYTYADYLTWMDNVRRELFDGFIKLMTPAPSRKHQKISAKMMKIWGVYLENKPCEVYHAPSDVRLPKGKQIKNNAQIYTVLQPDIYVICDLLKMDERGCLGAPDLIIEIVSANNSKVVLTSSGVTIETTVGDLEQIAKYGKRMKMENQYLPCEFTEEEMQKKAGEMANKLRERTTLNNEKLRAMANFSSRV